MYTEDDTYKKLRRVPYHTVISNLHSSDSYWECDRVIINYYKCKKYLETVPRFYPRFVKNWLIKKRGLKNIDISDFNIGILKDTGWTSKEFVEEYIKEIVVSHPVFDIRKVLPFLCLAAPFIIGLFIASITGSIIWIFATVVTIFFIALAGYIIEKIS